MDWSEALFGAWTNIARTLVVGLLAYLALVVALRLSGKRTLSKWNGFDFIVTVALGSSLATTLVSKSVTLAQGATGFVLLVGLQYLVTWMSVRLHWLQRLTKARPTLLVYRGDLQRGAMRRQRVPESEVLAAARAAGFADLSQIGAMVLETDGNFSVIARLEGGHSTLADVEGIPDKWRDRPR